MFQKVLYYSGFIFSCYAFVFILWQNQAYKFQRFKFHAFLMYISKVNNDHVVAIGHNKEQLWLLHLGIL